MREWTYSEDASSGTNERTSNGCESSDRGSDIGLIHQPIVLKSGVERTTDIDPISFTYWRSSDGG